MDTYPYRVYVFGSYLMWQVLTEAEADEIATTLDVIVDHRYHSIDWA